MDTVFIRGLRVQTIVGIYAWERDLLRPLILDLEMGTDTRAAAASDQVRDAIDYAAVAEAVTAVAVKLQPQLLETLAETIARDLFRRFPILTLKLRIDKTGAVAETDGIGIVIDRRREDYAVCGI